MAQGTPDGVTSNKQLTHADTQTLMAMKYFIDAQLKGIGASTEISEDVTAGSFTENLQSNDTSLEIDEAKEPTPETSRSELGTTETRSDEGSKLTKEDIENPVEEVPVKEDPLPVEESSGTMSAIAIESPKTGEEALDLTEKLVTPIEEPAKPLENTINASEKLMDTAEIVEQIAVAAPIETAPIETPDSIGLKTPETTSFDRLEVEKDILPKEVVDAADIDQDLEMTT